MDCIYHRCFRKNANDTNRIIAPNKICLVPIAKCFWKYNEDIPSTGVKTRSQYNKQPLVTRQGFDNYFGNKNKEDIERWSTAPDSVVRILKPSDLFYVI